MAIKKKICNLPCAMLVSGNKQPCLQSADLFWRQRTVHEERVMSGSGRGLANIIIIDTFFYDELPKKPLCTFLIIADMIFFYFWKYFFSVFFFDLLKFYPVTRFLVAPLLLTRFSVTLFSNAPFESPCTSLTNTGSAN